MAAAPQIRHRPRGGRQIHFRLPFDETQRCFGAVRRGDQKLFGPRHIVRLLRQVPSQLL